MTYLFKLQAVKYACFATTGSRVTPHLSISGRSTLGNMMRASCSSVLHLERSGDAPGACVVACVVGGCGLSPVDSVAAWNLANGTEKAKFGS